MRKKAKRNISQDYFKSNKSNIFHYKKEVETVLKLNLSPYNESQSFNSINFPSLSSEKHAMNSMRVDNSINSNILDNIRNNTNNEENKYEKDLNKFTNSLKQLKTYYPNNTDLLELEKYAGVKTPTRIEHIKLENNLKEKLLSYEKEENEIRNKKEILENQLLNIDNKIIDQQLNIEVVMGIEKENNNKVIRDKLISKFEEEYNKKEKENDVKGRKKNYTNSKEFQEELDLFMQREEYNTKQKAKEIENDIINNKNEKKEINEKLNLTLENLKNIHKNKNYVIQKLYNHYLNLLHEGKDTRNEGLSWIIREIFNLDKKVMLSYMPEFLDKLCIQYLFSMTHLNVEISEIEKEIKVCKEEFKNFEFTNKRNNFLFKNNLNKSRKNNNPKEFIDEKNEGMYEYLKKIRQTFCSSPNYNRNIKFNNSQPYLFKNSKIHNNKNISFKKQKTLLSLPFINGDPNWLAKSNKEVDYTNQLLKDVINDHIPKILKVKDLAKMTRKSGYFMSGDEIKKVQNYLNLNKKLNNLRKKKENMKFNEMTRIFKEFQRNGYGEKFNIDKISVISALIGEDNVKSELIKQTKREKKYIEEILKGRMHKKILGTDKSASVKNIYAGIQFNELSKRFKGLGIFEDIKNNEEYEKRYNSYGNNI